MEPVDVADLATAVETRLGENVDRPEKTDLKSFKRALNNEGGLEKLGQILAADLFNDNSDRFNPVNTQNSNIQGLYHMRFRCLTSPQNVFRVRVDGVDTVGVLDFIPVGAFPFKDINAPLAAIERANGPWPGRILADQAKRREYAENVVHDLETLLNLHKSRLSGRSKLKGHPIDRVVTGMVEGCRAITHKLQVKYHPLRWTAGMEDRDAVLRTAIGLRGR